MVAFSNGLDHFDGKRYNKACGIEVLPGPETVSLWQVNSKGKGSRCYLTVPKDKIADLIAELQAHVPCETADEAIARQWVSQ